MRPCAIFGCSQTVEPTRVEGAKSERFVSPDSKMATYYFPICDDPKNDLCLYHQKLAQGLLDPVKLNEYPREWKQSRADYLESHAKLDHDTSPTNPKRPTRIERMLSESKARRLEAKNSD